MLRMGHHICRMPSHLGIQATNTNCSFHHRSRIHCSVYCVPTSYPYAGAHKRNALLPHQITSGNPKDSLQGLEDNSGALEMAFTPKLCPRTKHINNAYHHFQGYTQPASDGAKPTVEIVPVSTEEQLGDMLMKPLLAPTFIKFHKTLLGW